MSSNMYANYCRRLGNCLRERSLGILSLLCALLFAFACTADDPGEEPAKTGHQAGGAGGGEQQEGGGGEGGDNHGGEDQGGAGGEAGSGGNGGNDSLEKELAKEEADEDAAFDGLIVRTTTPAGVRLGLAVSNTVLEKTGYEKKDLAIGLHAKDPKIDFDSEAVANVAGADVEFLPDGAVFYPAVWLKIVVPQKMLSQDRPFVGLAYYDQQAQLWQLEPMVRHDSDPRKAYVRLQHFSTYRVVTLAGASTVELAKPIEPATASTLKLGGLWPLKKTDKQWSWLRLKKPATSQTIKTWSVTTPSLDASLPALEEGFYQLEFGLTKIVEWTDETGSHSQEVSLRLWSKRLVIGMAVAGQPYEALAKKHLPVAQFHQTEQWLPVKLDQSYFTTPLSLGGVPTKNGAQTDITKLTGAAAMNAMAVSGFDNVALRSRVKNNLLLDGFIGSQAWGQSGTNVAGKDDIQVYYTVHLPSAGKLYLSYWYFYRHDKKSPSMADGAHDRDRESLTIVLSKKDGAFVPQQVVYAGHLSSQWMRFTDATSAEWKGNAVVVPWELVDRADEHPFIYLAEGSHALYPRAADYQVRPVPFYWLDEAAGGGKTYCPPDSTVCKLRWMDPGDSGTILLSPFPTMSEIDSTPGNPWRHLLFSGAWVDGAMWGMGNATFPPFVPRYYDTDGWVKGSTQIQTGSDLAARLCEPIVAWSVAPGTKYQGSGQLKNTESSYAGSGTGVRMGRSLAAVDLDGDHYDEVLTGAPGDGPGGSVFVIKGPIPPAGNLVFAGSSKIVGSQGDRLGYAVAGGDVNGDGHGDVLVGNDATSGGAYLLHGPLPSATTTAGANATFTAESGSDLGGTSVAVGNVDLDCLAEVLIGAPHANNNAGAAYLFMGGTSGGSLAGARAVIRGSGSENLGHAVALADVDGDGTRDVLVGAPHAGQGGCVHAYRLKDWSSNPIELKGVADAYTSLCGGPGDDVGWSVAAAGDVNGDRVPDLIIGAPRPSKGGRAYLVYGPLKPGVVDLPTAINVYELKGQWSTGLAGYAVAGGGDINGDGYDDVVIGEPLPYDDPQWVPVSGFAYVVYGPVSSDLKLGSLSGSAGAALITEKLGDWPGAALAMGQLSHDSAGRHADVVVGAPGPPLAWNWQFVYSIGKVYALFGGP